MEDDLGAGASEDAFALPGDRQIGLPPAQVAHPGRLRPPRNRVDAASGREQGADEMGAEEAGGARDEDGYGLQEEEILPQSERPEPL